MTTRIIITVRPDGTVTAATQGIKGPACLNEVPRIEALCGEQISESNLTADFYDATPINLVADQSESSETTE